MDAIESHYIYLIYEAIEKNKNIKYSLYKLFRTLSLLPASPEQWYRVSCHFLSSPGLVAHPFQVVYPDLVVCLSKNISLDA